MRVLGVDPGTHKTSVVVTEKRENEFFVYYLTSIINKDVSMKPGKLAKETSTEIKNILQIYDVELIVLEVLGRGAPNKKHTKFSKEKKIYMKNYIQNMCMMLSNEKPIVVAYAASGRHYRDDFYDPPGWRQKLTGLHRPNERDVLNELKFYNVKISKNERILSVEEYYSSSENKDLALNEIDVVGFTISFFLHPEIFEEFILPLNSIEKTIELENEFTFMWMK